MKEREKGKACLILSEPKYNNESTEFTEGLERVLHGSGPV